MIHHLKYIQKISFYCSFPCIANHSKQVTFLRVSVRWILNRSAKSLDIQALPKSLKFVKNIFATIRGMYIPTAFTQPHSCYNNICTHNHIQSELPLSSSCTHLVSPTPRRTHAAALVQQHLEDVVQKKPNASDPLDGVTVSRVRDSIDIWDSCRNLCQHCVYAEGCSWTRYQGTTFCNSVPGTVPRYLFTRFNHRGFNHRGFLEIPGFFQGKIWRIREKSWIHHQLLETRRLCLRDPSPLPQRPVAAAPGS